MKGDVDGKAKGKPLGAGGKGSKKQSVDAVLKSFVKWEGQQALNGNRERAELVERELRERGTGAGDSGQAYTTAAAAGDAFLLDFVMKQTYAEHNHTTHPPSEPWDDSKFKPSREV